MKFVVGAILVTLCGAVGISSVAIHNLELRISSQEVQYDHMMDIVGMQNGINDALIARIGVLESHAIRDFFPEVSKKKEIDWVTVDVQRSDGSKVLRLTNTTKNTYTWMRLDRRAIDYLWQKLFRDESL